jgi:hypothetical protein
MLPCTKCGETKPIDDFYTEPRNTLRHFRRTQCKKCDYLRVKKYKEENWEKVSARTLAYRRAKHRFFPQELFDKVFEEQGNVCAICKSPTPGGKGEFHADHNHETSQPRGVLCHNCNVALGNFKDNPEILKAAIEYLKKYSEAK